MKPRDLGLQVLWIPIIYKVQHQNIISQQWTFH